MVKVKIQMGTEEGARLYMWYFPKTNRWKALMTFIETQFPDLQSEYFIQYKDDEGDLITCAGEKDIDDAFKLAEEENIKYLRFFVIPSSVDKSVVRTPPFHLSSALFQELDLENSLFLCEIPGSSAPQPNCSVAMNHESQKQGSNHPEFW